MDKPRFSPRPNSAHLVEWRSWSPETLAEAVRLEKPLLLSISAVWCHWCHVMDETTYSEDEVISTVNENFVPVRVDADKRPDLDHLYNQGGWPTTAVLTPDGNLLDGATYLPPADMIRFLTAMMTVFHRHKDRIEEAIERIKAKRSEEEKPVPEAFPGREAIEEILDSAKSSYDREYAGFGTGMKFPYPDLLCLLMDEVRMGGDPEYGEIVENTLERMRAGDIYDPVEGGFFRYATRRDWTEPHYEKMLIDNVTLLGVYARALRLFGDNKGHRRAIEGVAAYMKNKLLDPETGGFYGSQDADEEYYRAEDRSGLTPPVVDKTIYADTTALAASSLIEAADATGDEELRNMGIGAVEMLFGHMDNPEKGICHFYPKEGEEAGSPRLTGLLVDNVLYAEALIDVWEHTAEKTMLRRAIEIGYMLLDKYYDAEKGVFRLSITRDVSQPDVRSGHFSFHEALGNYRASISMARLYHHSGDERFLEAHHSILKVHADIFSNYLPASALYGTALRWATAEPVEVTAITTLRETTSLLGRIRLPYIPIAVIRPRAIDRDRELLEKEGLDPEPRVVICTGKRCITSMEPDESLETKIDSAVSSLLGS